MNEALSSHLSPAHCGAAVSPRVVVSSTRAVPVTVKCGLLTLWLPRLWGPLSWLEPPPRAAHKPILSRVRPACTLGPPLLSHLSPLIPLFLFHSYLFIWDMRISDGFPAPPGLLQTCMVFKSPVLPAHILVEKMPSVSTLQRKLPHTYPVINTLSRYFSHYKGHQTPTSCFKLHVYHLGLRMAA